MQSLTILISSFINKIELFAKEKPILSLSIFVFLLMFGPPALTEIHRRISIFPYSETFASVKNTYNNTFDHGDSLLLILVVFLTLLFLSLKFVIDESSKIRDNFKSNLSKWSIPFYSNWKIQNAAGGLGKMLVVSNNRNPGLLKGAFGWYDYSLSFSAMFPIPSETKIPNVLGIFIRAKDSSNGIMLQFSESKFVPHYFFEGNYIIDNNQQSNLQTNLPQGEWVKFTVTVKGDDVSISFLSQKIYFNIKGYNFTFVPKNLLYKVPTISEIDQKSNENHEHFKNYLGSYRQYEAVINNPTSTESEKSQARSTFSQEEKSWNNIAIGTQGINLEYNQGSIGFREDDVEKVYIRDLVLKKID